MPGPLMDRDDQYGIAPQRYLTKYHDTVLEYVSGQELYLLPHENVTNISAVQVLAYESSEPIVRGAGFVDDNISCPGGAFNYLVRLYRPDPTNQPDVWHEEALVPNSHFQIEFKGNSTYVEETQRVEHNFKVVWQQPHFDVNPDESLLIPLDWQYPLGVPALKIPKEELPIASPPLGEDALNLDPPRNPPVLTNNKYRIYTDGLANATGYLLVNGTHIDVTNLNPRPRVGVMIVHYETETGELLDKA